MCVLPFELFLDTQSGKAKVGADRVASDKIYLSI